MSTKINKFFLATEFVCRCGCCHSNKIDPRLPWVATCVRVKFGKPVRITSALRCKEWNKKVGGASKSKHLDGMACDIQVKDVSPKEVAAFLEELFDGQYGIGYGETFTHFDLRDVPARFNY